MPSRPLESVVAVSYLTSGGGAKAVMGILLYLLPLLDAFTATEGRRGGVLFHLWWRLREAVMGILLYLLPLLDAFSATGGRRGGLLLYLLLLLDAFSAVRVYRGGVLPDLWRRRKGRHGHPTLSSAATRCLHSD